MLINKVVYFSAITICGSQRASYSFIAIMMKSGNCTPWILG